MTVRSFFLVPDEASACKITEDLRSLNIQDENIYAVAKRGSYPLVDIPEANVMQSSDVINAAKKGVTVGGVTGLFAGLSAVTLAPAGLIAAGGAGAVLGLTAAGAAVGTWASTLIGVSVPNKDLKDFQEAIDSGKILMLVDSEAKQTETVKRTVKKSHPEAVIASGELAK